MGPRNWCTGNMNKGPRILLIERYGIGDGVLSGPAIEALRKAYPDAHITSLATAGVAELRRPCPLIDHVIVMDRGFPGSIGPFDITVDLTGKMSTARLARRTEAPLRVGTPWWTTRLLAGLFYTHTVRPRPGIHVVEQKCDLAIAAGASRCLAPPRLWLTDEDHQAADAWLRSADINGSERIVALNPGSRSHGRAWHAEGFAAVCDAVAGIEGGVAVVIGGSEDVSMAQRIAALARHPPAVAAGMLTIRQTAALLSRCTAIVTGDTGPMHIAAAVGTRVVALFGRSDPRWSGPFGTGHVIVTAGLPCSPCRGMPHSRCRICLRRCSCMGRITPEQVVGALHQVLDQSRSVASS